MSESAMNRVNVYGPLVGFVVPTVLVAYAVVIPRSCIAGVNELSVGFATTMLGAVATYIVGVRRASGVSRGPLRERVGRFLSRQASRPSGLFGRFLGRLWVSESDAINDEAIAALAPRAGERVLEVGFGPGASIAKLAARGCEVAGVDVSPVMVGQAKARNAAAIEKGRVAIALGDGRDVPFDDTSVDAVLSVHSIYFWPDLKAALAEIRRTVRPRGRIVLAFRTASSEPSARFDREVYTFPDPPDVVAALVATGWETPTVTEARTGVGCVIVQALASR